MFKKFSLFWLTVLITLMSFLYVKYVYPETSNASESVDLYESYNLSHDQVKKWMDTHSPEEVQKLVEEHIQKEIENGATPVYGTISLNEEDASATMNIEQENRTEDSTFVQRFVQFLLDEALSKNE